MFFFLPFNWIAFIVFISCVEFQSSNIGLAKKFVRVLRNILEMNFLANPIQGHLTLPCFDVDDRGNDNSWQ